MVSKRIKLLYRIIIISVIVIAPITISILIYLNLGEVPEFSIEITSDSDFEKYNFPGSGTEQDPYRIENYTFSSTAYQTILIYNVTKHFIVRNNIIMFSQIGIDISTVAPNITRITQNTLSGGNIGIRIRYVSGSSINDNAFYNLDYAGIYVEKSQFCEIFNNIIYSEFLGIQIRDNSNINIYNNTIQANPYEGGTLELWFNIGIILERSLNISVRFNTLENLGLSISCSKLDDYLSLIIENNTINGFELGYFINQHNQVLNTSLYGQILIVNCTNFKITNQFINRSGSGLVLNFCKNCSIIENIFNYNRLEGIHLYRCNNVTIQNNAFYRNMRALEIWDSNKTMIKDCELEINYLGCYSSDSECLVNNCLFYNNEIGYHTTNFYTTLQDLITNNIFDQNLIGIETKDAACRIEFNDFYNNHYGCYIIGAGTSLLSNTFVNNTENIYFG